MKKEIKILGAIGNTARQNRDNMRVLHGGGSVYSLKAHIDKDHPLVIKKIVRRYEKVKQIRELSE